MKILLSATLALLLLGCSNEENSSSKQEVTQSVQKVAQVEKSVKQEMKKTTTVKSTKTVSKELIKEKSVVQKIDGAKLFAKCISCHGQNAEKKALNKSKIIRAWSVKQTVAAINGYKDGTYGSSMKGVMKPQVAKLTKAEVQAVAEYISKL